MPSSCPSSLPRGLKASRRKGLLDNRTTTIYTVSESNLAIFEEINAVNPLELDRR